MRYVCKPMTKLRMLLVILMCSAFIVCCIVPSLQAWFCIELGVLTWIQKLYVLINIPIIFAVVFGLSRFVDKKLKEFKTN